MELYQVVSLSRQRLRCSPEYLALYMRFAGIPNSVNGEALVVVDNSGEAQSTQSQPIFDGMTETVTPSVPDSHVTDVADDDYVREIPDGKSMCEKSVERRVLILLHTILCVGCPSQSHCRQETKEIG
jgi:hypothetical protein